MDQENELPRFHSAASAAAETGCDPATIRRQCTPAAYVFSSTSREFALYTQAEVDATKVRINPAMQARARLG